MPPESNPSTDERPGILVAARDEPVRTMLVSAFPDSFKIFTAGSAGEGERILADGGVGAVICSTHLSDMTGLEWLAQLKRRNASAMRIFAPERSTEPLAVAAVNKANVFRYISDATDHERLLAAVEEAIQAAGHRAGPSCMREAVGKAIKAHTLCRGSQKGCLVQAAQDIEDEQPTFIQSFSSYAGWTSMGILSMVFFLLAALFMGVGVFTILYVVKSTLGIDLIDGWHFTDWLQR